MLAAGRGTRLRPHTDTMPKPMVRVGGRPLLEWIVEWLEANGVDEIAVNLHHRPEALTEHFGGRLRYSYEPALLGTAGDLRLPLAGWLGTERFLVVYGDNLIDLIGGVVRLHRRERATATLALFEREDVSASGVAEIEGDRVISFREKPRAGETESRWVSAGLIVCDKLHVVDFVDASRPADFGADVLPAFLAAGETVAAYRMGEGESLHWIDTPRDLARLDELLRARSCR